MANHDKGCPACGGNGPDQGAELARLGRVLDTLQAARRLRAEARMNENASESALRRYREAANEFAATHPDFGPAYDFLCRHRNQELRDLGHADPATRRKLWESEEMNFVDQALRAGADPAERLYALAKRRGHGAEETPGDGGPARREPSKSELEALAEMSDDDFAQNWDRIINRKES